MDGDDEYTVADVVILVNCVLENNCLEPNLWLLGDMNGDCEYNVVDIVILHNCILSGDEEGYWTGTEWQDCPI